MADRTRTAWGLASAAAAVAIWLAGAAPHAAAPLGPVRVASPDGRLVAVIAGTGQASAATWRYRLEALRGATATELLAWSPLGLSRADADFTTLRLTGVSQASAAGGSYHLPHGKQRDVTWAATERVLHFESTDGHPLDLIVRVADDGLAFRYRFPERSTIPHTVTAEATGFTVPPGAAAWMRPHQATGKWAPAHEDMFQQVDAGTTSPSAAGWSYPALFHLRASGGWLLVTEAGLDPTYCGTRLRSEAPAGTYRVRLPDEAEGRGTGQVPPISTLPWTTPWRLVIAGDSLATIVESTLVTSLSAPALVPDAGWVRPGRSSAGWGNDDDASKTVDVVERFIDLSAEMHWEYSLIDANWHLLPDGALERVIAYAEARHVGLFLRYNSGGPHNDITEWGPRDRIVDPVQRRAEFARIAALGIKGVTVDFWQSDTQKLIQLYYAMMRDAAAAHLLIDFHGCTIPRGWSRTWPNLVSMEAAFAAEQYKDQARMGELGAWHNTVLAFTRNVIGPMDDAPVTLSDAQFPHQTTTAHEIALPVVFESGVTRFADGPEAYHALPDAAREFLREVPAAWDETRLLDGAPGRLALIARRQGDDWWVGGISGLADPQTVSLDLDFLGDSGEWDALIVRDGAVPRQVVTEAATVRAVDHFNIPLLPRGGCALRFRRR